VFNDVAVALRVLRAEGVIRRALVVDADVHQGNGTAAIFRDDPDVYTFDVFGERNFPFTKVPSDHDVPLADGTADAAYLGTLDRELPRAFTAARPELVVYLAGADPFVGDRLGRLALSHEGLAARDRCVLDMSRARGCAVAIVMAGGYAIPVADTVRIHAHTVRLVADRAGSATRQ
jgi:acetoin utilization deacetylase AcuC-like enzyme